MGQLTNAVKATRVINATAAGVTTVNGSTIDMQDFDGCRFLVAIGAVVAGSVSSVKLQDGNASNLSDAADVAGSGQNITAGGTDDNSVIIIDIFRPVKRYLRVVVLRATQNLTIDGAIAEQYEGVFFPVTQDATTIKHSKIVVSPADGTP